MTNRYLISGNDIFGMVNISGRRTDVHSANARLVDAR